jgi:hypothetical protein
MRRKQGQQDAILEKPKDSLCSLKESAADALFASEDL